MAFANVVAEAATYNDSCRTVSHYGGVVLKKPIITATSADRYGYLLCFRQRIAPMTEPSPAAPSMNGRPMGITSQARTARPSETIAPARFPGTDTLPHVVGEVGRGLSAIRAVNVTSVMDRLVISGPHDQWYSIQALRYATD
jgi:hypothetical protein